MATNSLQQVITYQAGGLGLLVNQNAVIGTANTKFRDFARGATANLGSTVSFDLPPRGRTTDGTLVVSSFGNSAQRVQNLTVDQASTYSYEFTDEQFIFNVDEYMDKFGKSAVAELGAKVETNVSTNFLSHTYRFFGDGVTPINSFTQLAQVMANYRDYGAPNYDVRGYLPVTDVPTIIGSGLSQFVMNRNEEIADSWKLGTAPGSNATWYQSNLLPVHTAGNVGQNATQLTFVSINAAGDQITFSGAGVSDADAIKENDLLEFETNVRYLTFVGHSPSRQTVQFRATADAASNGAGQVVVSIFPALIFSATDPNANLTRALAVTDTAVALPSHRAGAVVGGNALYLAMPKLPIERPYDSVSEYDPETGVAMRLTYGTILGQNQIGFINSVIWGSTLVDEYAMRLVFPV